MRDQEEATDTLEIMDNVGHLSLRWAATQRGRAALYTGCSCSYHQRVNLESSSVALCATARGGMLCSVGLSGLLPQKVLTVIWEPPCIGRSALMLRKGGRSGAGHSRQHYSDRLPIVHVPPLVPEERRRSLGLPVLRESSQVWSSIRLLHARHLVCSLSLAIWVSARPFVSTASMRRLLSCWQQAQHLCLHRGASV